MIYDFRCPECGITAEDVTLGIMHEDHEHPECCGSNMRHHITKAPSVRWRDPLLLNGGFIAHGMKGQPVITSLKQNRDLMERNGLIDATEVFGAPPTQEEQSKAVEVMNDSIAAVTPTSQQMKVLKSDGLDSIL